MRHSCPVLRENCPASRIEARQGDCLHFFLTDTFSTKIAQGLYGRNNLEFFALFWKVKGYAELTPGSRRSLVAFRRRFLQLRGSTRVPPEVRPRLSLNRNLLGPRAAMLDAAFIREHLDDVIANCKNRNVKADPARAVQLDDERNRLEQQTQTLQQRQNEVSKLIPKEKDAPAKQKLVAEGKALREQVSGLEKQRDQIKEVLHA